MSGGEAAAVIGLIASVAQLVDVAKRIVDTIQEFREKNQRANSVLGSIGTEVNIIQAALILIKTWLERECSYDKYDKERVNGLQDAIIGYEPALCALLLEVEQTKSSLRARIKYIWDDAHLKRTLEEVPWQGNALQLLLHATRLSVSMWSFLFEEILTQVRPPVEAKRTIRAVSVENSTRRGIELPFRSKGGNDEDDDAVSSKQFTFDDEVITSAAYRAAMRAAQKRSKESSQLTGLKWQNPTILLFATNSCPSSGPCQFTDDALRYSGYKNGRYIGFPTQLNGIAIPQDAWKISVRTMVSCKEDEPPKPNSRQRIYVYGGTCLMYLAITWYLHIKSRIHHSVVVRVDDRVPVANCCSQLQVIANMRALQHIDHTHVTSLLASSIDRVWVDQRVHALSFQDKSADTTHSFDAAPFISDGFQATDCGAIVLITSTQGCRDVCENLHAAFDTAQISDGNVYLMEQTSEAGWTGSYYCRLT